MHSAASRQRLLDRLRSHESHLVKEAVQAVIVPGDVVIELDAGLGRVTATMLRAGARLVHCWEPTELADSLALSVKEWGAADRVLVHRDLHSLLEVDHADVLVTRIFPEGVRSGRLWARLGRLTRSGWYPGLRQVVPARVRASMAGVDGSPGFRQVRPWQSWDLGIRGHSLAIFGAAHPVLAPLVPSSLLTDPVVLWEIGLGEQLMPGTWPGEVELEMQRSGQLHGIVLRLEAELAPGRWCAPTSPDGEVAEALLFPFDLPREVAAGEKVRACLALEVETGRWTVGPQPSPQVRSGPGPGPAEWSERGISARLALAVLESLEAGVSRHELLGTVFRRLGARDRSEQRLIRRRVQWLLASGLAEPRPGPGL